MATKAKKKVKGKVEEIVITGADGKPLSKRFVAKAQKEDASIREQWTELGKSWVRFGLACMGFKNSGYFVAILIPDTATGKMKPCTNFGEYIEGVTGKSRAQVFAMMRNIKELTSEGPGQVALEDLEDMTQQNAEVLVKLRHEQPSAVTARVIEAAKTLPERRFQEVLPNRPAPVSVAERSTDESLQLVKVGPFLVTKVVGDRFDYAIKIARALVPDDDRSVSLTDKCLMAIAANFIATFEPEFLEIEEREKQEALARATQTDEGISQAGSDDEDEEDVQTNVPKAGAGGDDEEEEPVAASAEEQI